MDLKLQTLTRTAQRMMREKAMAEGKHCPCPDCKREMGRLRDLLAEIARDAVGPDAPLNWGLNSVSAVVCNFLPEGKWTEERLEAALRGEE